MNWYKKAKEELDFNRLISTIQSFSSNSFGGNCGVFAFALAKFLKDYGIHSSLVFFSDARENSDFFYSDVGLYHVAVILDDDRILDGDGFTSLQAIVDNIVYPEYDNPRPQVNFYAVDNSSLAAIRYNTNYSSDWQVFYKEIKKRYLDKNAVDNKIFETEDEEDEEDEGDEA